jgi:hypothetical protein
MAHARSGDRSLQPLTMMLLDMADAALRYDGYATRRSTIAVEDIPRASVLFESEAVLGAVLSFAEPGELLDAWEAVQTEFLRAHAARLRLDPMKAWSAYLVLLAAQPATENEEAKLIQVEEDLRATRKLARAGVSTAADVQRALLPLLMVQSGPGENQRDAESALRARLSLEESRLFDFLQQGDPETALRWVLSEVQASRVSGS